METYDYYADGKWLAPAGGQYFDSHDPYTAETWARIARCTAADANIAVTAAYRAYRDGPWGRMHPGERGLMLRRLGDAVARHADRLATIDTRDNGKRRIDIYPGLTGWLIESPWPEATPSARSDRRSRDGRSDANPASIAASA